MKIYVRMTTKYDSAALRRFAENEVMRKLRTRALQVGRIDIRLKDVNGPRGGVDKLCIVRIALPGSGDVVTRGEATAWYDAVSLALWGARTALDRRLAKKKQRRVRETRYGRSIDTMATGSGRGPA